MTEQFPSPEQIAQARAALERRIVKTPMLALQTDPIARPFSLTRQAAVKLELFQHAGSFKARGNLLGIDRLSEAQRSAGVVAASGGNHALAVAWAAQQQDIDATLVVPKATDPARVEACRALGGRVILADSIAATFAEMNRIAETEGATVMHPFEGEHMTLGAATLGAEIAEEFPEIDLMVVAVGGGGLIGGLAAAVKQARPECEVVGVEPTGADSLYRSFEVGEPVELEQVKTVADSLGSPRALPFSFGVAQTHVDRVVRIPDDRIIDAAKLMRDGLNLMVEPACAAALAAVSGPLQSDLADRSVCVLACGSNIGKERYGSLIGD